MSVGFGWCDWCVLGWGGGGVCVVPMILGRVWMGGGVLGGGVVAGEMAVCDALDLLQRAEVLPLVGLPCTFVREPVR